MQCAVQIRLESDDTHTMEAVIRTGAPILLVQRSTPPAQFEGTAVAAMGNVIAVKLLAPWSGLPDEEVAIIAGEPGARLLANARLAHARAQVASFELVNGWQQLDLRTTTRYRTELGAEVRSVLGDSRQPGSIVDLSYGGIAVMVSSKPGGREVAVVMRAGGFSATLPCRIAQAVTSDRGVLLHLEFMELTGGQQAFIRTVVASIQAALLFREQQAS